MTWLPQLMTVPGVSPLACASFRAQDEAAVTTKATNILSFMVSISSRHLLLVEPERGRSHSRRATGKWMARRNALGASRLGRASGGGLESGMSAFAGEPQSRGRQMDHRFFVVCWWSRIRRFG